MASVLLHQEGIGIVTVGWGSDRGEVRRGRRGRRGRRRRGRRLAPAEGEVPLVLEEGVMEAAAQDPAAEPPEEAHHLGVRRLGPPPERGLHLRRGGRDQVPVPLVQAAEAPQR